MDLNKLITRAKAILLTPRTEWPVIATESTAPRELYLGYVVWLAALPAIAGFLKSAVFGFGMPLVGTFRVPTGVALSSAVMSYVLSLLGVFLLALIIDALAPTFGATRNRQQALKVAAYSYTAGWVGGAAVIIPGIGWLLALAGGIYSIYLLYLGLPVLMKCAAERAVGYTAVIVIAAIVFYWIIGLVAAGVTGRSMTGMMNTAPITRDAGSGITVAPGAAGEILSAALGGGDKQVVALGPERISGFLPATLAGMARVDHSAERNSAMGMQVSVARARYRDGDRSLQVEITDMGSARGLMSLASWANLESERETSTGFEKTYKQGDNVIHEQWDSAHGRGQYNTVLAQRFMVEVEGNARNIDELRAAASSIDLAGLASLRNEGVSAR